MQKRAASKATVSFDMTEKSNFKDKTVIPGTDILTLGCHC